MNEIPRSLMWMLVALTAIVEAVLAVYVSTVARRGVLFGSALTELVWTLTPGALMLWLFWMLRGPGAAG